MLELGANELARRLVPAVEVAADVAELGDGDELRAVVEAVGALRWQRRGRQRPVRSDDLLQRIHEAPLRRPLVEELEEELGDLRIPRPADVALGPLGGRRDRVAALPLSLRRHLLRPRPFELLLEGNVLVPARLRRRLLAEQQALGHLIPLAVVVAHVPGRAPVEARVQRALVSSLVLHPDNVSSLPDLRSDAAAPAAAHGEMQLLAD